jgi:hypothetical protein
MMSSFFPASEFDGRLLIFNPSDGHWQTYPNEASHNQNWKLLIEASTTNEECVFLSGKKRFRFNILAEKYFTFCFKIAIAKLRNQQF